MQYTNTSEIAVDTGARVIYRDALMLVIDKPAGIAVHRGRGEGPNLESQLDQLRFGLPRAPALAHRLDRETSGCLALGRHRKALARLNQLFRNNRIEKTYLAILRGSPAGDSGLIDSAIGPASDDPRDWRVRISPDGAAAETRFRVIARGNGACLVELQPKTGRTHQLRVHGASIGHPIIGDAVYGDGRAKSAARTMLHAAKLLVPLYPRREAILTVAAPPPDFLACLMSFGLAMPGPATP